LSLSRLLSGTFCCLLRRFCGFCARLRGRGRSRAGAPSPSPGADAPAGCGTQPRVWGGCWGGGCGVGAPRDPQHGEGSCPARALPARCSCEAKPPLLAPSRGCSRAAGLFLRPREAEGRGMDAGLRGWRVLCQHRLPRVWVKSGKAVGSRPLRRGDRPWEAPGHSPGCVLLGQIGVIALEKVNQGRKRSPALGGRLGWPGLISLLWYFGIKLFRNNLRGFPAVAN